jgi:thioredoxin 1
MTMTKSYESVEPLRETIDALRGPAVIEFGTPWCGYCRAAQHLIGPAFADHPHVRHIKVVDGKGHPLGRSFHVKLWPTLVFLRDGKEITRIVRPGTVGAIRQALAQIDVAELS